jgi:hypothetical protein
MNALAFLACSLGRKDEHPNEQLAIQIIQTQNKQWVSELVDGLSNKDKNIQSDCIKVLYEIGQRGSPELIAPHFNAFLKLLSGKNNRLIWGAMYALDTVTLHCQDLVMENLSIVVQAIDKGSVITIDCGVSILAKLCNKKKFSTTTFPLLMEQLKKCPSKQVPMYAEKSYQYIQSENLAEYSELLKNRFTELTSDSQKRRVEKLIKKLSNR